MKMQILKERRDLKRQWKCQWQWKGFIEILFFDNVKHQEQKFVTNIATTTVDNVNDKKDNVLH